MSLPFNILVARAAAKQPHRPIVKIASEISRKLAAERKARREYKNQRAREIYAETRAWTSKYDNY